MKNISVTTFEEICALEPEVSEIYAAAKAAKPGENARQLWRANFQPRLGTLVGRQARNKALRSYETFAIAIDAVRVALEFKEPSGGGSR